MTSGNRIKILRILGGFTQQALADMADVSRASVMWWEKDKLPTRRTAMRLASLFEVSVEYLLEGVNPPAYALWKPIAPGHPKHLHDLAKDMEQGISSLFRDLGIVFAAKGETSGGKLFWLCGDSPDSVEWKLNYLITHDNSLDTCLFHAIRASGSSVTDLGTIHSFDGWGELVSAAAESLQQVYGHYPNCVSIYNRLGGLESEGDEDFTLEGLLKRWGREIANSDIMADDLETMASYIAKEIIRHSGLSDIKCSSRKLLRAARKHVRDSWSK